MAADVRPASPAPLPEEVGNGVDLWREEDSDAVEGGVETRVVLRLVVDGSDVGAWAGCTRTAAADGRVVSEGILSAELSEDRRELLLRGADGAVQTVDVDVLARRRAARG